MAEKRERIRIENIKDITANWERANPILLDGEIGIEVKLNGQLAMKIGDGITHWKELDYVTSLTAKEIETLLNKKVDKIEGMGLSENNYSDEEKAKLAALGNGINFKGHLDSIELLPSTATVGDMYFVSGENSTTLCCVYSDKNEWEMFTVFSVDLSDYITWDSLDSELSEASENPVKNKAISFAISTLDTRVTADISAHDKKIITAENDIAELKSRADANDTVVGSLSKSLQNAVFKSNVDTELSTESTNPIQNKPVATKIKSLEIIDTRHSDQITQNAMNIANNLAKIETNTSNIAINKTTLGYQKKNLMKLAYAPGYIHTDNAKTVTWTFNSDYSLSMVVTTALTSGMALEHSRITLQPGTYIYSVEGYSTPSITHTQLYSINADGTGNWLANYSAIENTLTVTEETTYSFRAYRNSAVVVNVTEKFYPMLRYADITDDTFEPYIESVDERLNKFTSQKQLYSNTTGGNSPLTATVSNLFAKYSAVICNIVTSNGKYNVTLPLRYIKSLGTEEYYEAESLLFYYVDDNKITIKTGLAQSNPTISNIEIIGLY